MQISNGCSFSCCRVQPLGTQASVAVEQEVVSWGSWALEYAGFVVVACRLSSCGSQALEHSLISCGKEPIWNIPGSGIEPVSPELAGGFLFTVPPESNWSHNSVHT